MQYIGANERGGGDRERDRDRDRETETDSERQRQTDRDKDSETQRDTDRQTETERDRDREREGERVNWCFTPSQPVRLYQGEEKDGSDILKETARNGTQCQSVHVGVEGRMSVVVCWCRG